MNDAQTFSSTESLCVVHYSYNRSDTPLGRKAQQLLAPLRWSQALFGQHVQYTIAQTISRIGGTSLPSRSTSHVARSCRNSLRVCSSSATISCSATSPTAISSEG